MKKQITVNVKNKKPKKTKFDSVYRLLPRRLYKDLKKAWREKCKDGTVGQVISSKGMGSVRRKPTSPGEILKLEYLTPFRLTQQEFARHLEVDVKVINRLINNRTRLTLKLASRIASALNTSVEFWLKAQMAVDVFRAEMPCDPVFVLGVSKLDRDAVVV